MAELADAQDLGSCEAIRVGSTPTTRTKGPWNLVIPGAFSIKNPEPFTRNCSCLASNAKAYGRADVDKKETVQDNRLLPWTVLSEYPFCGEGGQCPVILPFISRIFSRLL